MALPLYPQWGTEPNGFYIPPRQAPRGYIRQMFGPGVDNAIEKYLVPSRELLAVLQLWRASQQIIFRYDVIPGPKVFETQIHGKKFEMALSRKAIYKRPEDGIVLIDQNRCRGYKKCVEQCPYKK